MGLIIATLVSCDDWQALYINNFLAADVEQNHTLDVLSVLEAVTQSTCNGFDHFEVDEDWAVSNCPFPEKLDDIPENVRIIS